MPALVHQPKSIAAKVLRPFRLKYRSPDGYPVGKHVQADPKMPRKPGETDEGFLKRATTIYFPGDVVESFDDLNALYPEKFERADAYNDPTKNPYLTQMAPGELQEDFERRMARLQGQDQKAEAAASQADKDHKQENDVKSPERLTDIPVNPVQQAAKQGAHRLSHLKLEQMTTKQLQEIIDSEEIDTGGKTLAKAADMAKVIRDWMLTSR